MNRAGVCDDVELSHELRLCVFERRDDDAYDSEQRLGLSRRRGIGSNDADETERERGMICYEWRVLLGLECNVARCTILAAHREQIG